jgi:hypothetical protein
MLDPEVTAKIIEMTNARMFVNIKTTYYWTLKQLLHLFGNIYYTDSNNNMIKISCVNGKQERQIGKMFRDSTLTLPYITITESVTDNNDERRRYNPVLVNEKFWDKDSMTAKRLLSLAPRPIDLSYDINIWTKYAEDMDTIRWTIYNMFNPDLEIRTPQNDFAKAFIVGDTDRGSFEAEDTKDRVLRRTITILVETYLQSPKFLYTNTGSIEQFNVEVGILNHSQNIKTDKPIETVEVKQKI